MRSGRLNCLSECGELSLRKHKQHRKNRQASVDHGANVTQGSGVRDQGSENSKPGSRKRDDFLFCRLVRLGPEQAAEDAAFLRAEHALVALGIEHRLPLVERHRPQVLEGMLDERLTVGRKAL
jgi:hypothetical protein